ncbi:rod shape-determining protein MreC [Altererythrobacter lutimaris]|uniref:Cell shape-determining protein MreC n=1 Tax=Altererythrobacter lutimaris TaxID=2743979 RepID=A0A850H3K9_9SPHN|nr:rod shape-determining protein MreC [Altererythrobacter lutimaris]NVE93747.1 rod shape-determining protein MreC [Altererythrobacter lutimaris]
MAPPSSRRSGHSRRAQYSVFTGYVIAGIGALIGGVLLGISFWQPQAFSGLRNGANEVVAPAGEATSTVRSGSSGFFDSVSGYLKRGSEYAALKEEVELARIRLAEAEAVEQENARLKALLDLKDNDIEPVTVSRLVGSTSSSTRRFAYLGAGSADGVAVGQPVRSPRGVVGRVLEVSINSSRVLLLTDSESVLPVRRASDEIVAFAEGRGDGLLRIRLINLGLNPLEVGDVFVTSGAGGYYRPGVAVAVLSEITDDGGIARLIADPSATDFVSVDPIWQPGAVDSAATPIEQELGEETSDD